MGWYDPCLYNRFTFLDCTAVAMYEQVSVLIITAVVIYEQAAVYTLH